MTVSPESSNFRPPRAPPTFFLAGVEFATNPILVRLRATFVVRFRPPMESPGPSCIRPMKSRLFPFGRGFNGVIHRISQEMQEGIFHFLQNLFVNGEIGSLHDKVDIFSFVLS